MPAFLPISGIARISRKLSYTLSATHIPTKIKIKTKIPKKQKREEIEANNVDTTISNIVPTATSTNKNDVTVDTYGKKSTTEMIPTFNNKTSVEQSVYELMIKQPMWKNIKQTMDSPIQQLQLTIDNQRST